MKKIVELNPMQLAGVLSTQKNKYFECGRGSGKSTLLGWYVKEAVRQMPRSTGILAGSTYMQMLSRTLPSTKEGLEMFGLFENIDYVVGRRGLSLGFELPFQSPSRWDNTLHFRNGAILAMVSLDRSDTGRGLNSYYVIGDEAALLDSERLFNNVQTTNRAKKAIFNKASLLNAEIFASTTPMTKKGKWFVEMEKEAIKHPDEYVFIKASALVNKHNLAADWFDKMRSKAPSQMHYEAEILNIRPRAITDGFYPQLNPETHYYENYNFEYFDKLGMNYSKHSFNCQQDADINPTKPLIVSIDWGTINSMVVSQQVGNKFNVLKSLWVKSPKIIDDLIAEEFAPYYRHHAKKEILFYYDRNGNSRVANSKYTYAQQATNIFKNHGWRVIVKTPRTLDPAHFDKFIIINYLLRNGGTKDLPSIRINQHNAADLIISLENAEAKEGRNGIVKDKSSERSKSTPQEHATHLSDAFDLPLYWMFKDRVLSLIENKESWVPNLFGNRK